jgi:type IV secretory pathway TraG/TraD family ATPase VirD4
MRIGAWRQRRQWAIVQRSAGLSGLSVRGPLRLLLNQLCRALTQRMDFAPPSPLPSGRRPLLLTMDEFAVLGRLLSAGRWPI